MSSTMNHTRSGSRGFSLMELMVVIAILGILSTVVVTNVLPMLAKGKTSATQASIKAIESSLVTYYTIHGRLPESLDVLTQEDPEYANEVYIKADELTDGWNNPFEYRPKGGRKYEILSLGADGMPGGEGEDEDISSDNLKGT